MTTTTQLPVDVIDRCKNVQTVEEHYNQLAKRSLNEQKHLSRIYHLRNFHNWITDVLITDTVRRVREDLPADDCSLRVLDLASGKGGDLHKWKKSGVQHVICADLSEMSQEICKQRYNELKGQHEVTGLKQQHSNQHDRGYLKQKNNQNGMHQMKEHDEQFTAEFITADCTKEWLLYRYEYPCACLHITSCQFALHYSYESEPQAEMMVRNACEGLDVGGYFIGTIPNANELLKHLRSAQGMTFGNEVYKVTFQTADKQHLPLFGAQYDFHLEGVVDCPEFLVYFPLLEKMAKAYGMDLVYVKPFSAYYEELRSSQRGHTDTQKLCGFEGKLSSAEVEASSLYLAFAFKKTNKKPRAKLHS